MTRTGNNNPTSRPAPTERRLADGRRALSIAGAAGGVGTTTLAHAVRGIDRGVFTGGVVDVLVCRATGDSLVGAARAAQLIANETSRRPVLAVTATEGGAPSRAVMARIRLVTPHVRAVVMLPHVRRWCDMERPLTELRGVLGSPLAEFPRHLRKYAIAARDIGATATGTARGTVQAIAGPVSGHARRSGIGRTSIAQRSPQ